MNLKIAIAAGLLVAATTAIAHQNVENPVVKARMDAMSAIAADMKTLARVAKSTTPFDAEQVRLTVRSIADYASKTPDFFRAQEDDPVSEALALIWQDFDDFAAKSDDLRMLATELSTKISQQSDVSPAMLALGASCKSCHRKFRE